MSKIRQILLLLVIVLLSGCLPGEVAKKHLPTLHNAGRFKYGSWIVAELKGRKDLAKVKVSGELISLQDHKLFILDTAKMNVIHDSSVSRARLFIYKKQPGIFVILTLVGILPNVIAAIAVPEYAGQLLALGIVPIVIGTIFMVSEVASTRNQLIFPQRNSLDQFIKYSRFPQGIPPGLDISMLKLPGLK